MEWKPEKDYVTDEHERLGFAARFGAGLPRINDGALLFLQHMISKMKAPPESYTLGPIKGVKEGEGSRIAIVFNGSPLFTGDAGSGESNIRRIGVPIKSSTNQKILTTATFYSNLSLLLHLLFK